MPDEPTPRRFFSEKEISRVLRRATEMQEGAQTTDPTGLTYEELRQIAAEAGIDPQYLSAAVASLDQVEDTEAPFHWLGAPIAVNLERVVAGEVSEEQWERMVGEIRTAFSLVGASGQVGRSREWTHDSKDRQAQVTVTSREGQTKIRIFAKYPQIAAVTFIPALSMGIPIALGVLGNMDPPQLPVGIAVLVGVLGTLFIALRFLFAQVMRGKERKAKDLITRLERIAAESAATPQALPAETAQIDASVLSGALEATEEEAQTVRSRRQQSL